MMRKMLSINLLALILVATISLVSQGKQPSEPPGNQLLAVNTARLINTAEAKLAAAHKEFLAFPDLVSSGALREAAAMNEDLNSAYGKLDLQNEAELVRGFAFKMVVGSDGQDYKISLIEKSKCGMAFFTDNGGLIYSGKVIGCANK